jgi:predicted acetyltransferase
MASLATPAARFRESFLAAAREFAEEGRLDSTYCVGLGYSLADLEPRFGEFVRDLVALSDPDRLRPGRYLDHVLWLVEADEFLGQTSIRPELSSEYLLAYGGHIGYSIRPSRRKQGYGTQALALTLKAAASLGLSRVLVTCDSDNPGSRLIIERTRGVYEGAMTMPARAFRSEGRPPRPGVTKRRYWIELGDSVLT